MGKTEYESSLKLPFNMSNIALFYISVNYIIEDIENYIPKLHLVKRQLMQLFDEMKPYAVKLKMEEKISGQTVMIDF